MVGVIGVVARLGEALASSSDDPLSDAAKGQSGFFFLIESDQLIAFMS